MCKPVMQVVLHVTNTLLVVKEMQVHARQKMHWSRVQVSLFRIIFLLPWGTSTGREKIGLKQYYWREAEMLMHTFTKKIQSHIYLSYF